MDQDEGRGPARHPLLDPRLAGAGGMLIAAAAVAWLITSGSDHADPTPPPTPPTVQSAAARPGNSPAQATQFPTVLTNTSATKAR
ncbi:hypothetical protein [Streptacidiphilus sp. EB129]|uniref:hypothetical protein n=1 Tax=Streptacidiphilus sp. EB129 TaxID=3156262 RepID=UPI00351671E1